MSSLIGLAKLQAMMAGANAQQGFSDLLDELRDAGVIAADDYSKAQQAKRHQQDAPTPGARIIMILDTLLRDHADHKIAEWVLARAEEHASGRCGCGQHHGDSDEHAKPPMDFAGPMVNGPKGKQ